MMLNYPSAWNASEFFQTHSGCLPLSSATKQSATFKPFIYWVNSSQRSRRAGALLKLFVTIAAYVSVCVLWSFPTTKTSFCTEIITHHLWWPHTLLSCSCLQSLAAHPSLQALLVFTILKLMGREAVILFLLNIEHILLMKDDWDLLDDELQSSLAERFSWGLCFQNQWI